ncbi:hypothetical protein JAO73_13400 [Hymenobacter sp. BT523]|uniref:hypothetical protein n=1 Tax=Hymenobacter sp. BT523 TaxID=2795725 RepID=UPI0018ED8B61|nr:hypothetical protein [Hymenobacter sp. BT523]MBJ6110012.1 hypothetical protein [Hymenobacter sp. BT523]
MPQHTKKDLFTLSLDCLNIRLNHSFPVALDLTTLHPSTALPIYVQGSTTLTMLTDDKRNSSYHLSYSVDVSGKRIGVVDVNPVRAHYAANLVHYRADNRLLYTASLLSAIRQFMADFNLLFHNYAKLDIALDTNVDVMKRFNKYFFNPETYHFHKNKKQIEKINAFGSVSRNGDTNFTVYLAENVGGRSLKLYNKTREIAESSNKGYITDYHSANGLDVSKDVWRLELSITNNAIKDTDYIYRLKTDYNTAITYDKYSKLEQTEKALYTRESKGKDYNPIFSQLQDSEHLLSLFNCYGESIAEFRKKDDSNKTRCTRMPLIHLGDNIKPIIPNEYIITASKSEENTMKHNIRFNFDQFQKRNNLLYLEVAKDIALNGNLIDYYDSLYHKYQSVISAYNHSILNYNNNSKSLF